MKQIKILSLGDESARTPQNYLPKIAKCDSVEIIVGAVYKKDATLCSHTRSLREDLHDYRFVYNKEGSVRFDTVEDCSLTEALDWHNWDYVVIQQSVSLAGDKESYTPYVSELESMIKEICKSTVVVLNEPCVQGVRNACIDAVKSSNIKVILPVARAWENAKKTAPGSIDAESMCGGREGDFLAACVWYEVFTGNNVTKNSYRLPFVESETTAFIKSAVHEVSYRYAL